MPTHLNPSVHLHYASLELLKNKKFSAKILGWLSAEEKKRYQRFVSTQQAQQYLLSRALLRSQLSNRVRYVLPCEWVFVVDDYGKPKLAEAFSYLDLHFNLSHSEDLVVLALGKGLGGVLGRGLGGGLNLGIDVESIHRPVFNMALATRYFAKVELTDLMKLTERQQIKRIAQLWTLKESYLKANGVGLRVPLSKLAFSFKGQSDLELSVSSSLAETLTVEKGSSIALFCLWSDYSVALTIDTDKAIDISAVTINEWFGLNEQTSCLSWKLLRTTGSQSFSRDLL